MFMLDSGMWDIALDSVQDKVVQSSNKVLSPGNPIYYTKILFSVKSVEKV